MWFDSEICSFKTHNPFAKSPSSKLSNCVSTHLQDKIPRRPGYPPEIYKPDRFDGSFHVPMTEILTG